jgi:hypothetical protein
MKSFRFSLLVRWILFYVAVLLLAGCAPGLILSSGGVEAKESALQTGLPGLAAFTDQVRNGHADQITGVYADGIFALPVVQQPDGEPAYISSLPETLTQFASASAYGTLGFVAHNTLAGRLFPELKVNSTFSVIYGDGTPVLYQVIQIRHMKALQPDSTTSSYVDEDTGSQLSYQDLFFQTYGHPGWAILQTCIAADGIDSWGRLFIIADRSMPVQIPLAKSPPPSSVHRKAYHHHHRW